MAKAPIDIRSLARQHTRTALRRLVSVAEDPNHPKTVEAAIALLNRGWGMPTQKIEGELNVNYAISDQPLNEGEWIAAHVEQTAH